MSAITAVMSRARTIAADERIGIKAVLLRLLGRRPHDSIGLAVALVAACAILTNGLYMQSGPHPAPMFPTIKRPVSAWDTTGSVIVMPRPRPAAEAAPAAKVETPARPRAQIISDIQRELSRRGHYDGAVDGVYGPKLDAALRDFEQASGQKTNGELTEAALQMIARAPLKAAPAAGAKPGVTQVKADPIADLIAPSKRVIAIQRALADYGYGQVKPTGVHDPATRGAIEKFERDRKLPITGQVSDRLVRELAAVTGRPLE